MPFISMQSFGKLLLRFLKNAGESSSGDRIRDEVSYGSRGKLYKRKIFPRKIDFPESNFKLL